MKRLCMIMAGVAALFATVGGARAETAAPPPAVDGKDQLDISAAISLGTHANVLAQNAAKTRALYAASIDNGLLSISVDPLDWPAQGNAGKQVNARTWIFWKENGQVVGGHFDWQAVGQTAKTLENVYGGYLGRKPAPGQTVWFALVSIDGAERTNVVQSQNPW